MQLMQQVGQTRNQTTQAEESLASLDRDAQRLAAEMESVKRDLESLGAERGQVSMKFESVTETLKRLESEIETVRSEIAAKRTAEAEAKKRGDQLRAEHGGRVERPACPEGVALDRRIGLHHRRRDDESEQNQNEHGSVERAGDASRIASIGQRQRVHQRHDDDDRVERERHTREANVLARDMDCLRRPAHMATSEWR